MVTFSFTFAFGWCHLFHFLDCQNGNFPPSVLKIEVWTTYWNMSTFFVFSVVKIAVIVTKLRKLAMYNFANYCANVLGLGNMLFVDNPTLI